MVPRRLEHWRGPAELWGRGAFQSLGSTEIPSILDGISDPARKSAKNAEKFGRDLGLIDNRTVKILTFDPLPGIEPYTNHRVMRVRQLQHGMRLIEFLCDHHPPTPLRDWEKWLAAGDIVLDPGRGDRMPTQSSATSGDRIVTGGERYVHRMHGVTEPWVRATVGVIHEDESLLVVDKPAPLPVHPSGRYNRHSLSKLLQSEYPDQTLRIAHRLDANTSGVVVFTRTALAAALVQPQFERRTVKKEYLASVVGHCPWSRHRCDLPIGSAAELGSFRDTRGARIVHPDGLKSETLFEVLQRHEDQTTLVKAIPTTGRTNQIRVHLWALGFPIVGDPLYLPHQRLGTQQTLTRDDPPMCLHAMRISLVHPTSGEEVTFTSQQDLPIGERS